jgi:CDP-diacylglycerol pyrophosphatase
MQQRHLPLDSYRDGHGPRYRSCDPSLNIPEMNKFVLIILLFIPLTAYCGVQDIVEKSNPNALWWVVSSCVYNEQHTHLSAPCEQADLEQGYTLLKDRRGKTQFLLIPTERISGIESPEILAPAAVNYWLPAWKARKYVSERAGKRLSDRDIGLAINSSYGRTQNQLHIHIDCLKPEVINTLKANKEEQTGKWFKIRFPQPLHSYSALYVDSLKADPFKLLAKNTKDMSRETLAVARMDKGFVLLADTADMKQGGNNRGSSEELLDHKCRAAD